MQVLINIDVDDLDKATHFYETAFGLKVGRRFGADGVEMLGSSAPIYPAPQGRRHCGLEHVYSAPQLRSHWTPIHLDFVVDEIESAVRQAVDAGARLENAVATHKWGRLALMADPFGHGFCFVQFLGRGYDEIVE
jgi:predicted enzyme related to lactoylglutathione lyase